MNVNRASFAASLDEVRRRILDSDYVAFDTELSGLNFEETRNNMFDSLDDRYCAAAASASVFQLVQLGICTVKRQRDGSFECAPFNFTLFPGEFAKNDKLFGVSSSALTFLSQHGFDFNNWVAEGVPFLSRDQEKKLRAKGYGKAAPKTVVEQQPAADASTSTSTTSTSTAPTATSTVADDPATAPTPAAKEAKKEEKRDPVVLDAPSEKYVADELRKIDAFFAASTKDDDVYRCAPTNGFKRLLLHQEIPIRRGETLQCSSEGEGDQKRIVVYRKRTEEQQRQMLEARELEKEQALVAAIGVRHIYDAMCESNAGLICHNGLLDLLHLINTFVGPLPPTVADLCELLRTNHRGGIYDTKLICSTDVRFKSKFSDTALAQVLESAKTLYNNAVSNPSQQQQPPQQQELSSTSSTASTSTSSATPALVSLAPSFANVLDGVSAHQAGFDAYLTAQAFCYLARLAEIADANAGN